MKTETTMPVQSLDRAINRMNSLYKYFGSWRKVGAYLSVPAGTCCSVAKGREPKNPEYRRVLGLPVLQLVSECPTCHVVHVGHCPNRSNLSSKGDLFSYTTKELERMLIHRETF